MYLVVPLMALIIVKIVELPPAVEAALLVLAISFVVLLVLLGGKLLEAGWFALLVLAGMAFIVAAALPGPGTAALIGAYLIASMAVSVPYLQWRKRSLATRKA